MLTLDLLELPDAPASLAARLGPRLRLLRIAEALADAADDAGDDAVAVVAGQLALAILDGDEWRLAAAVVAAAAEGGGS